MAKVIIHVELDLDNAEDMTRDEIVSMAEDWLYENIKNEENNLDEFIIIEQ